MTRVLIVSVYPPGRVPAARFRYEQYLPALAAMGIAAELCPFFTRAGYEAAHRGSLPARLATLGRGLAARIGLILRCPPCDVVLLHREALPLRWSFVEWALSRLHGKRIVYDFDDAIWLRPDGMGRLAFWLRTGGKFDRLVAMADHVVAGNAYLAARARRLNPAVTVIPTVVDTAARFATVREHRPGPVTIAWTGSSSTTAYLADFAPVLRAVKAERDVRFLFISDRFRPIDLPDKEEVTWSEAAEVAALARADIGIMPLPDDPWTRGKCGFKIIQYIALGLVPVASAVGANKDIVAHGKDGFLCRTETEWKQALLAAIDDVALRRRIGAAARAKAVAQYSVASQAGRLAAILAGRAADAAEG